jgi:ABC-2 type transport system ATP-binding protein
VTESKPAIEVSDLCKSFDEIEAVRGVSFEVAAGEVFGFLGPNGAGRRRRSTCSAR